MTSVTGHAALVAAVLALGFAALRSAAALGARGLEAVVAAAPVGAALAALWALTLGTVAALGGSPVALLAGALVTAALAAARLPAADLGVAAWWRGLGTGERVALGAAAGAGLAWVAWLVKHPGLAIDPLTYHLPESVMWVQQGTPGSVELITYEFPQGNYPVTNEVLVAWLMGLGRSFAPALLWTPAMGALLAAAGWLGLRARGVSRAATALAVAGVLLVPVAATQFLGAHTDLPALTWLAVAAALVATGRPALLAPAVLAGALAVGTKTTVAPLAVLVLAAGLWRDRRALPWPALTLALAAGAVVGGAWYVRNLIDHGSPLWPFIATPWGDPVPRFLDEFDVAFLDRPAATLEGRAGAYVDLLGGGLLLLGGGIAAGLVLAAARRWERRAALGASAAAALAALAWANAPFTGAPDDPAFDLSLTTTRYLLPAVAAGAAALALAGGRVALAVLAAAALLGLDRSLALSFPGVPSAAVLATGALAGGLAGAVWRRRPRAAAAAVAGTLASVLALSVIADGFAARHGGIGRLASSGVVSWFAARPPDDLPVAFAPQMLAVLAGDDLRRPITMIPADEPCALTRARRGWVVVGEFPLAERRRSFDAAACLEDLRPAYADGVFRAYRLP